MHALNLAALRRAALAVLVVCWLLASAHAADSTQCDDASLAKILEFAASRPRPQEGRRATVLAFEEHAVGLRTLALPYLEKVASGPARAQVLLALDAARPRFITWMREDFDAHPSDDLIKYDRNGQEAWRQKLDGWLVELERDSTATADQREAATVALIGGAIWRATTPQELDRLQSRIESLAKAGTERGRVRQLQESLSYAYGAQELSAHENYLRRAAGSDIAEIKEGAEAALVTLQKRRELLPQLRFTAADGREVDVGKLRGKVVLVDFWATWCGPCVAELPNVAACYRKYREHGFEVVGIAFENAQFVDEKSLRRERARNPNATVDTPDVQAGKLAKTRRRLLDFAAERGLAWPQHCDGRYWENEFGRPLGIQSLPAMFLLDREGRLVSTTAKGENLEREVQRLLGL